MLRRTLLGTASLAATQSTWLTLAFAKGALRPQGQVYEWRTYTFATPEKQITFEAFLQNAAVAAWNRAGVRPVGLFKMTAADNPGWTGNFNQLFVLLPHTSLGALASVEDRLARDLVLQRDGKDVLGATKADPAYLRWQSTVFSAFEGKPNIVLPRLDDPGSRVFELRTYESHNEARALNKISMFEHGEFPLFERAGMPGVFFGRALAGADLPQLTYMVAHTRREDVKAHWKAFFDDAAWKSLSAEPAYADNVSKVTATFLRPLPASQV